MDFTCVTHCLQDNTDVSKVSLSSTNTLMGEVLIMVKYLFDGAHVSIRATLVSSKSTLALSLTISSP